MEEIPSFHESAPSNHRAVTFSTGFSDVAAAAYLTSLEVATFISVATVWLSLSQLLSNLLSIVDSVRRV